MTVLETALRRAKRCAYQNILVKPQCVTSEESLVVLRMCNLYAIENGVFINCTFEHHRMPSYINTLDAVLTIVSSALCVRSTVAPNSRLSRIRASGDGTISGEVVFTSVSSSGLGSGGISKIRNALAFRIYLERCKLAVQGEDVSEILRLLP